MRWRRGICWSKPCGPIRAMPRRTTGWAGWSALRSRSAPGPSTRRAAGSTRTATGRTSSRSSAISSSSGDLEPQDLLAELQHVAGVQLVGLLRPDAHEDAARRRAEVDHCDRAVLRDPHLGVARPELRVGGEVQVAAGPANADGGAG